MPKKGIAISSPSKGEALIWSINRSDGQKETPMSKPQDRTISQRSDGSWENKRNDSERASSVHQTQAEAQQAAREMLANQGGGEMTTRGVDGKIRAKDTIAPGNDPRNVKG